MPLFRGNKFLAKFLVPITVTFVLVVAILLNSFQGLHHKFSDTLFNLNEPSQEIVIVAIDDKTTQAPPIGLGRFSQWGVANFTKLLEILQKEQSKVITFDILFQNATEVVTRPTLLSLEKEVKNAKNNQERLGIYDNFINEYRNPLKHPDDVGFAEELEKHSNVILMSAIGPDGLASPLPKYSKSTTLGIVNAYPDDDGIIRTTMPNFTVEGDVYDNISVATVKKYLSKSALNLPVEKNGEFIVNFFADPYSYEMVSFVDVLNGRYSAGAFKDKIVLVGVTDSKQIHDEHYTPRSDAGQMPGIEFRANEIQTILDGKFLHNQSTLSQILTIAGISMTLATILSYLGVVLSVVVTFTAIILYVLAAHFFYRQGLILNMIYPFIAIVLTYLASWVYKYFVADKKKREMKNAFGHYVSKELVEQISNNPDLVKLGGEKRQVTVFFSDIQDSTALSEQIAIEEWVKQINEYFTAMERIVMQSGGTLDKYEGDAIMAFWNAPIAQQDHVLRGYLAALTMMKTLKQLQQKWQQEGKPAISIRIGINTGDALVGNFGSENRLDYTVMGDTVNTASRLESAANKSYKTRICVSGISESQKPSGMILRELDKVLLPGKKEAVSIFELVCAANEYTPEMQQIVTTYQQGLAAYRAKNWQEAIAHFSALSLDPPSQVMLERCQVLVNGGAVEGLEMEGMVFRIAHK